MQTFSYCHPLNKGSYLFHIRTLLHAKLNRINNNNSLIFIFLKWTYVAKIGIHWLPICILWKDWNLSGSKSGTHKNISASKEYLHAFIQDYPWHPFLQHMPEFVTQKHMLELVMNDFWSPKIKIRHPSWNRLIRGMW